MLRRPPRFGAKALSVRPGDPIEDGPATRRDREGERHATAGDARPEAAVGEREQGASGSDPGRSKAIGWGGGTGRAGPSVVLRPLFAKAGHPRQARSVRRRTGETITPLHSPMATSRLPIASMTASLRFLIADDNKDAGETLAALLTHERHEVRLVHDGRRAVDMALSWEPDVVVLDLQMPEMSGFVAAELIRRDTNVAVLAALTGLSGQTVREQVEKAGFDVFFSKGVAYSELSDALIALARKRRRGR